MGPGRQKRQMFPQATPPFRLLLAKWERTNPNIRLQNNSPTCVTVEAGETTGSAAIGKDHPLPPSCIPGK